MHSFLSSIRHRCSDAIRRGAPIYNNGNIVECERIYSNLRQEIISDCGKKINSPNQDEPPNYEVLNTLEIMKNIQLKPSDQSNERNSSSDQNAWNLRRGLDTVLANLEQYEGKNESPFGNSHMKSIVKGREC